MSRRQPDRGLRRLVAELATAAPEDLDSILEGLEAPQRRTVTGLLAAYAGAAEAPEKPRAPPQPAATPPPPRTAGLSPWLALRLRQGPRAAAAADPAGTWLGASAARRAPGRIVARTPAALRALRACAASLEAQRKPARPAGTTDRVISRVRGAILGRRLAS
jgi:hypothetical protein